MLRSLACLALLLAPPDEAQAQTQPAARAWARRVDNTLFFVLNPLGVMDSLDVTWTRPVNRSDDLLHKDAHIAAGLMNRVTPAFLRTAPWFEYSPLSIVDLRVGVEPVFYFGTFKAFLTFNRPSADFSDDVIKDRQDEAAAGFAGRVFFAPTLKAKAGPVVARVRAEVSYWKAGSEGEPYFYEPVLDTLLKASGSTTLTLEALALREFDLDGDKKFLLGPVYDLTSVKEASGNRKQDIGLIAAWSKSGSFHAVKSPSLAAKIVYFLEDPIRRHEPAAFLTLGFGF
jgi:hypothetical protein